MSGLTFGLVLGEKPPNASANDVIRLGIQAESDGYDVAWVCDHLLDIGPLNEPWNPDPWGVIGYLAAKTERIRFATSVTDYQKVHPAKLAQIMATLDELSRGRISLGIGTGEAMNNVPFGIPWESASVRVEKLGEYIQVIRLLWKARNSSSVSFGGKYYLLQDAWIDIAAAALQARPPIYIGAFSSTRLLRLVGRLGDGWLPLYLTPELYQQKLQVILGAAKEAGRDLESIEPACYVVPVVSSDPKITEESIRNLKIPIASVCPFLCETEGVRLPSTRLELNYQKMTSSEILSKEAMDTLSRIAEYVPDSLVRKVVPIGNVDEVIGWLESRIRVGARHIVVCPTCGAPQENLRAFRERIIPYFKDLGKDL
jgi:phthiodiolone/phenolphthiodiolone dimycocerosates ketoreductase